jgi:hypothetical protein
MSPPAITGRPLQYFIHYDFDALRMELAGSLVGRAAQKANEAWRSATLMARRWPWVVDISYITEADEDGRVVLRQWLQQGVRILASSVASRAIANSIPSAHVPTALPHRTLLDRVVSWFSRSTAGNPARAERRKVPPAGVKENNADNARFPLGGEMEQEVR